jgi:hypothetical protein
MTATFEHIQTITLTSAQNKIQFTSLPQTFTDLVFYGTVKSAAPAAQVSHLISRFGNSAYDATGYSHIAAFARSTTNSYEASAAFNQAQLRPFHYSYIPRDTSRFGIFVMSLFNYASTTVIKSYQNTSGGIGAEDYAGIEFQNGFLNSTSAINQIEFGHWNYTYDLDTGSEISVYGIKKE